ncbi:MAG: diacylglycerol kinase family protein [Candidatus Nanopelagicales bacterium]
MSVRSGRANHHQPATPAVTSQSARAEPVPDSKVVAIVNPTKVGDVEAARAWLDKQFADHGEPGPTWVQTTVDDPGAGQARAAVESGAHLVLSWGGDGTARAVADGLAQSDVALGIIPGGTGNLLARNLDIPLDLEAAVLVALTGTDRVIDLLEVGLGGRTMTGAVIAGMGLDAAMMQAPEGLKSRVGPAAYVVGMAKGLRRGQMRVGVAVDGSAPRWMSARTVLVANVGGLVAGLDVVPEAQPDDGRLKVVVLPLRSAVDWARTAASLVRRPAGTGPSRVVLTGRSALIVARSPQPRQVDGDVVAKGSRLEVRVRPGALRVRVPEG